MLLEKNNVKETCLNLVKREWLEIEHSFPSFLPEVTDEIKLQNENYIKTISFDFQKQVKAFSHIKIGKKRWKKKTMEMIENILYHETVIGVHRSMNRSELDDFQEELKEFLRHVRLFAPKLSIEEIGQAIRNYIVYAMFNEIHAVPAVFNIAGFGYSMLYPFTDNYIDSTNYSVKEKSEYNQMIRDKIEGTPVHPSCEYLSKTCELLQMIESVYPREKDDTVFHLLLMMLEAQEDSIRQQKKGVSLSPEERLNISLYKGGVSVLIDRYFVKKEITQTDLTFYLGFGFFLQLADDLQDIKEDSINGSQTLFTIDLSCEREEQLVNQLLHFIHHIMDTYPAENDQFKTFILSNCYQLILSAVIQSKEFFSKEYLKQIERYLPVTALSYENMRRNQPEGKDAKTQSRYLKVLDTLLFETDALTDRRK